MKANIKQQLCLLCYEAVAQRIANAQNAIDVAKESANDDSKSSAGDKHETGRAMAQLEQEKSAIQLNESIELKKEVEKIDFTNSAGSAQLGSLVITDKGNFFISVPIGKLNINQQTYFAVSPSSPIGMKVRNLKKNDSFDMNGLVYKILEII